MSSTARAGLQLHSSWATSSDRSARATARAWIGFFPRGDRYEAVVTVWAWIGLLAASPAATQARAQAQPGLKIGFISSQQILEQTRATPRPSPRSRRSTGLSRRGSEAAAQFDSAVQTFEKQSIALSSSAKATKQKELQALHSAWSSVTELQTRASSASGS